MRTRLVFLLIPEGHGFGRRVRRNASGNVDIELASLATFRGVLLYPWLFCVPSFRPTGLLRRRMKADVTNVRPRSEGHTKGLDRAIQVHVIKRILIVPNTGTWVSHFVTHKPNPVVVWTWFKLVHCGARRYPGLNGGLHPHRATDRCKVEISGAGNLELAIRGIVKHVALIRMRLAPGVLVWTKISGFAKIGRTRILCRVQVADINPDPVRHAVVMVASVIVGARW